MRSQEARRREAWQLLAGEIAVVSGLSLLYAAWFAPDAGLVLGRLVTLLGAGYLAFQEFRPMATHWREAWRTDPSFERILTLKGASAFQLTVMKALARLDTPGPLRPRDSELHSIRVALRKVAGFSAITLGTLVQLMAAWPPR